MRSKIGYYILVCLFLVGCKFAFGKIYEGVVAFVERWDNDLPKKEGQLREGLQSGDWTYYYQDGRRRATGEYAADVQVGAWTAWYEGGNVEWQGAFAKGLRTGQWTYFHKNGSRRAQGFYRADREDGGWQFWDGDGRRSERGDFDAGRRTMTWTALYPDGKKKSEGLWFNGVKVGVWKLWSADGKLAETEYPLPKDVKFARENWPGGAIRRAGFLEGDQPIGRWVTWHDNGNRRFDCAFRGGKPEGSWRAYRPGDELLAAGSVENGKIIGDWTVWVDGKENPAAADPVVQTAPLTGEWSPASFCEKEPVGVVVGTWLAEVCSPASAVPVAKKTAPEPPPERVAELDENPRVPAKLQPDWTVREIQELPAYLETFFSGKKPARKPRIRYAPRARRKDEPTNRRPDLEGKPLPTKVFKTASGKRLDLTKYEGKKKVLFVVLRGFGGQVCVYCVAQTKALDKSKKMLSALGVEVVVVFPGPEGDERSFLEAYKMTFDEDEPPYDVLYDPELKLVTALGLAGGDLAYPSTFLLDEGGIIRYAYVGAHRADRPAVTDLVRVIEGLGKR